jgi:hypothetical protein
MMMMIIIIIIIIIVIIAGSCSTLCPTGFVSSEAHRSCSGTVAATRVLVILCPANRIPKDDDWNGSSLSLSTDPMLTLSAPVPVVSGGTRTTRARHITTLSKTPPVMTGMDHPLAVN